MAEELDITGQRYGKLTALDRAGSDSETGGMGVLWDFLCDCGRLTTKPLAIVRGLDKRGLSPRCEECAKPKSDAETRFRWIWKAIRQRCNNPRYGQYKDYGGRGISVCDRWASFANFKEDMWGSYSPGMQIDRIDNEGDYSPENCRWVTHRDNSKKRRDSNLIPTPDGETMTVTDAAKRYGISEKTLRSRVNKGWPAHRWFEPVQPCGTRSRKD